ncbi:MAG: N-acetylmuramoyl-L-alanine amidase, partial [Ginsengibacter sp.]
AKERSTFANDHKADLFISIHVDASVSKNDLSGLTVIIPKKDNVFLKQSQFLGSAIIQTFRNNYPLPVADDLKQLEQGIWVLKANEYPAILIETGFLSNQKDVDYLINPKNQKVIAENILKGIEKYADQNLMNTAGTQISNTQNTTDTNKSNVFARLEGNAVIEDRINKVTARADTAIIINSADNSSNSNINAAPGTIILYGSDTGRYPIYFLDGKEISKEKMNTISPGSIESIQVLKGESAIAVYGQKGKNGVILILSKPAKSNTSMIMHANEDINSTTIHLKNENNNNDNVNTLLNKNLNISKATDSLPDKVFTKVENEASFPGGQQAWIKYIVSKIQAVQDSFTNKDFGTCLIKFIVNTDGSISHVEATTMKHTHLAETAMNAIKTGPKWIPATQNGQTVAAYRLQPVTLTNPTAK